MVVFDPIPTLLALTSAPLQNFTNQSDSVASSYGQGNKYDSSDNSGVSNTRSSATGGSFDKDSSGIASQSGTFDGSSSRAHEKSQENIESRATKGDFDSLDKTGSARTGTGYGSSATDNTYSGSDDTSKLSSGNKYGDNTTSSSSDNYGGNTTDNVEGDGHKKHGESRYVPIAAVNDYSDNHAFQASSKRLRMSSPSRYHLALNTLINKPLVAK